MSHPKLLDHLGQVCPLSPGSQSNIQKQRSVSMHDKSEIHFRNTWGRPQPCILLNRGLKHLCLPCLSWGHLKMLHLYTVALLKSFKFTVFILFFIIWFILYFKKEYIVFCFICLVCLCFERAVCNFQKILVNNDAVSLRLNVIDRHHADSLLFNKVVNKMLTAC